MKKLKFNKKNIIITISFLIIFLIFVSLNIKQDKNTKPETKTTTVDECVDLSSKIRINEKTKECFDKLSSEEFLSLYNNEENMKLYNEIDTYYDKRTESEKAEDLKKTEAYIDEVIKNLETNPEAYKR